MKLKAFTALNAGNVEIEINLWSAGSCSSVEGCVVEINHMTQSCELKMLLTGSIVELNLQL